MENESFNDTAVRCPAPGEERWWVFLVTCALIYIIGFSLCLTAYSIYRLVTRKLKRSTKNRDDDRQYSYLKVVRDFFQKLTAGQTILSKILIVITLLCNLIYIALAIFRSFPPHLPEECLTVTEDYEKIVELTVTVELILFSIIRFLATDNIVLYWLNVHTIVDVLTLPYVFVTIALGVDWIGLRCLRFFWMTQIVTVLQFTPLVRTQDVVDGINLLIYFLILWLTSSGIIHLVESQGDPWRGFENGDSNHTILIYAYYIMVTMSTVGYGDILPLTDLGRTFMTFFIIGGLAFFAAILPKLAGLTSSYYQKTQYVDFITSQVPKHVIVCGHITADTVRDFLKDFFHPDRGETLTHVLFLHPERPGGDLKNVLHSYCSRVHFLLGSVLNGKDLIKAKIHKSTIIFILTNKHTANPIQEDRANILMMASVKNTNDNTPVMVQLLHSESKKLICEIEGWKEGKDIALCLNEMKLGLLAQSCLCPGFSTMIANLFYTSQSPADYEEYWMKEYAAGSSNEIYTSTFSKTFHKKSFHEAAKICYVELKLILIAIQTSTKSGKIFYAINPSPVLHPKLKIRSVDSEDVGYFIAQCQEDVLAVATYGLTTRRISLRRSSLRTSQRRIIVHKYHFSENNNESTSESIVLFPNQSQNIEMDSIVVRKEEEDENPSQINEVDVTPSHSSVTTECVTTHPGRMIYKEDMTITHVQPNKIEDVILNLDNASVSTVNASPRHRIRDHIILCIFSDDKSPHLGLDCFLEPLRSTHLSSENIKPVVIISERAFIEKEWSGISSTPEVYYVIGCPLQWSNLKAAGVMNCSVCVILSVLSSSSDMAHELASRDKEAILCSIAIKKKLKAAKKNVQVITDLYHESNVQFLSFDDADDPEGCFYNAVPFACGEAFSASMFDSATCSVINGPNILNIVEDLITEHSSSVRCGIFPIPISDTGFLGEMFEQFFVEKLKEYMLCIAISRILPSTDGDKMATTNNMWDKRYIITSPPPTLVLKEGDLAIVLVEQRNSKNQSR